MLALLAAFLLQQAGPAAPATPLPRAAPAAPRAAPAPKAVPAVPEAPAPQGVLRGAWPSAPSGKVVTLDDTITRDDALEAIAEAAGWNLVLNTGRTGNAQLVLKLREVPVEEALQFALEGTDLVATRRGNSVVVAPAGAPGRRHAEDDAVQAERDARQAERDAREAERDRRSGGRTSRDRVVQGDVTVQAGEVVRDVVAIRGNVVLRPGAEARDVVAVIGKVSLEPGARARQAVAILGDVTLAPGAEIERDTVAVGGNVRSDPGAEIGGEQTSVGLPALSGLGALAALPLGHGGPWLDAAGAIVKFIVYFLVGLLVVTLFPRRVEGVSAAMVARPAKSVMVGLLGFFLAGLLCLLLLVTLVGALLIPVVVVAVIAAGVLGFVALSFHVGKLLPIRSERRLVALQLAAGTALLVLATHIPLLGWLVWIAAALLTFGAALVSRFGQQEPPVLPTSVIPPSGPAPA